MAFLLRPPHFVHNHVKAKSAPASRAGSNSSGNKRGARGATRAACVKESGVTLAGCETNDKGKKAVQALRDDLKKDARNSIGEAEAECEKLGESNDRKGIGRLTRNF